MPVVEIPFTVEPNYAGWRLDRYLQQKISRLSRTRIQKLIRERLRCESGSLKPASPVYGGLHFVLLKDVDDTPEPEAGGPVRIVYDDPHLVVVDKPPMMAVHPSARYFRHTLTQWLGEHALGEDGVRPDLAHRLDRETSGLVACGRGVEATRRLKAAFARRDIEKSYLALVEGRVNRESFDVDLPLRLTERALKVVMEAHPEGMPSRTRVTVLRHGRVSADGASVTLLECRPHTGRQHQIRVHLQAIGHPIVGDKIYGGDEARFLRFYEGALTEEDQVALRLPRQALHAFRLGLPHPHTGARLQVEAPLPEDIAAFCAQEVAWDPGTEVPGARLPAGRLRPTGSGA